MDLLISHCAAAFSQTGGVFALFFLAGLTGSLTHCLSMCGPVVACQSACSSTCGQRANAASQWQYHLGRFVTYGAFGFLAALLSKQFTAMPYWPTVSSAMMLMAGFLFLISALFPGRHSLRGHITQNHFLRGVLMSFMPCGLIYAALMMAATITDPLMGMFAMWLFVLGTLPALLAVSGGAAMLAVKWQEMMRGIGRFGMVFNGLALLVMASKAVR